jgi:uncharacterized protein
MRRGTGQWLVLQERRRLQIIDHGGTITGMTATSTPPAPPAPFDPSAITRPDPALLRYYIVTALFTGPLIIVVIWPMLFRYHSLRYRFDDRGVAMSWGVLFKREIYLTYRRIQDIHVTRGLIQRWFGLASVAVQTASGSSGAEMTIEGITHPERLRDFLYEQMRGAKGETAAAGLPPPAASEAAGDEALQLLREIRDQLRTMRQQRETIP